MALRRYPPPTDSLRPYGGSTAFSGLAVSVRRLSTSTGCAPGAPPPGVESARVEAVCPEDIDYLSHQLVVWWRGLLE